jgi:hypothetical protein
VGAVTRSLGDCSRVAEGSPRCPCNPPAWRPRAPLLTCYETRGMRGGFTRPVGPARLWRRRPRPGRHGSADGRPGARPFRWPPCRRGRRTAASPRPGTPGRRVCVHRSARHPGPSSSAGGREHQRPSVAEPAVDPGDPQRPERPGDNFLVRRLYGRQEGGRGDDRLACRPSGTGQQRERGRGHHHPRRRHGPPSGLVRSPTHATHTGTAAVVCLTSVMVLSSVPAGVGSRAVAALPAHAAARPVRGVCDVSRDAAARESRCIPVLSARDLTAW